MTAPGRAPAAPAPGGPRPMVAVDAVTRWFGDVVAVSDVSFSLGAGVTALLGPNGAGKSTLLRLLCGLVPPARGTVRVLGRDPRTDVDVHGQLALVPQQETVFERLTAFEFVETCAALRGVAQSRRVARLALGLVELDPDDPRPLPTYSRGMRQRVKVAQALVHDPAVIVLDEPLTGLDPRQRRHMTELFHRLGDSGRCVIVSSHVLEEVERFGSNVLVIVQGRLAAEGDFHAIRDLMDDRPHRIRIRTDAPHRVAGRLLAERAVLGLEVVADDSVIVETDTVHQLRTSVARVAREEAARLWEITPLDDDLDSVFRYLVGRR